MLHGHIQAHIVSYRVNSRRWLTKRDKQAKRSVDIHLDPSVVWRRYLIHISDLREQNLFTVFIAVRVAI
jgi:hypothetical protein